MRHNVYGSHLSRTSEARLLLFRSLIENLFLYKSIQTTESKAKTVKGLVDRVITQAKAKNYRSSVASFLKNKNALNELVSQILPNLGNRKSGFTSLVRVGQRKGDGAMMVRMNLLLEQSSEKQKTGKPKSENRKSRRTAK